MAWPVGGAVELHDHGDSAGAVVVASGRLVETSLHPDADGRLVARSAPVGAGGHVAVRAGPRPRPGQRRARPGAQRARLLPGTADHDLLRAAAAARTWWPSAPSTTATGCWSDDPDRGRAGRPGPTPDRPGRPRRARRGRAPAAAWWSTSGRRPSAPRRASCDGARGDRAERARVAARPRGRPPRSPRSGTTSRCVVVVCSEGYASSLAAASLADLGFANAADLEGGYRAWRAWNDRQGGPAVRPVLVALHAHPDDEAIFTGGTIVRAVAAGWRVVLVVATDGDRGTGPGAPAGSSPPTGGPRPARPPPCSGSSGWRSSATATPAAAPGAGVPTGVAPGAVSRPAPWPRPTWTARPPTSGGSWSRRGPPR